jgi:hypothetical protein
MSVCPHPRDKGWRSLSCADGGFGFFESYPRAETWDAYGQPLSGQGLAGLYLSGPYIGQRKWRDHTRPPKIKGPPNQYLVVKSN